jgi:hypothetical protein
MAGVRILATSLENLIRQEWLKQVSTEWQCLAALCWAFVIVAISYFLSHWPRGEMLLVCLLAASLLFAASLYVEWHYHWWWSWIGPVIGQTIIAFALVWRSPKPDPYIAFLSYRTVEDGAAALLIYKALKDRGYKAFLDSESLDNGDFDKQLLFQIEASKAFVPILSPNSLAACVDEKDWLRQELVHALVKQKVIIPFMRRGFDFDAAEIPNLPEINKLKTKQGVFYMPLSIDADIKTLIKRLKRRRRI